MQFPCEILVKNILPAIRAIMVKELFEKYDKPQKEIAELLGVTQPSVSYYLHGERGGKAIEIIKEETKDIYQKILDLTEQLVTEKITTPELLKEICGICMKVRPLYIQRVSPNKFEFLNEWNVCFKDD